MGSPVDDRGVDAFLALLREGGKGPRPKVEVLEALSLRPIWLATWEPRAEGFRTLINANGEEALAVFSSEAELRTAATQFEWLESDGSIASHRAIGGDILRHAWTREYAFVVIDIAAEHSLEYPRSEIKNILRDLDSTGSFRTSRPPPSPAATKSAASSFPAPVEKPVERISTTYSMAPRQEEKIEHLSEIPTKPHEIPYDSEPPTQPRAALPKREAPQRPRKSSHPKRKRAREPSGSRVEEVGAAEAKLGDGGTYGAASVIPPASAPPTAPDEQPRREPKQEEAVSATRPPSPESSSAPKLNSEAPTAPAAQPLPTLQPGKLKLPAVGPIGPSGVEPPPPGAEDGAVDHKADARASRVAAPSIGDGIKLVELLEPPDDELLKSLGGVLRGYFEVEWASYCHVGRPAGGPSPAIGLRIADNYRENVTAIIKDLCEAGRKHEIEIDVLLIDGHDMLRKAREKAYVFYPWKPKA